MTSLCHFTLQLLLESPEPATMTVLKPINSYTLATHQLVEGAGKNRADHSVLRENLEHYNSQLESPICDLWDIADQAVERPPEEARWLKKIQRDMNSPYSDSDVAQHLGKLDSELVDLVRVKGSAFPAKVFVTGGVNKGRFGGNSDLDVLSEGLLSDRSCEHLAAKPGWEVHKTVDQQGQTLAQSVHSPSGVNAQFLQSPEFQEVANWYGAHFVVDVESAKQGNTGIPEAVVQGFEAKGLKVKLDEQGLELSSDGHIDRALEEPREYPSVYEGQESVIVDGRMPSVKEKLTDWLHKS